MKKDLLFLVVVVLALAVVLVLRAGGGTAATPGVFDDAYDLDRAMVLSAETGKPFVAVAPADWCPPCQTLKRGALSEPEVVAYLREHTIPVYIEESTGIEQIRALGVLRYPTTVVLDADSVFGVIEGGKSPGQYLELIRTAIGASG
ncbi:MAG: thioredoxin family protein [Planctomycetota bacterium]